MKFADDAIYKIAICRSPCGERGLKYQIPLLMRVCAGSLPVRGAWVEMCLEV